jgi:hypothetical protein
VGPLFLLSLVTGFLVVGAPFSSPLWPAPLVLPHRWPKGGTEIFAHSSIEWFRGVVEQIREEVW